MAPPPVAAPRSSAPTLRRRDVRTLLLAGFLLGFLSSAASAAPLALQLRLSTISGLLCRHGSEVTSGGCRRSRMTLELWAVVAAGGEGRIRPLFTQERMAVSAGLFLDGLLGPERRKTGWMRAEAAGDPGPWRQQAILGRGRWEADALRDMVRDYALEALADAEAVLVIDETGFLKQGEARAAWRGSTRARRARSPTARSACSRPTCPATATPSSTGRCICPRPGPTTRPAWPRRTCRPA